MSLITDIRGTVATKIALKQTLGQFYFANDFVLKVTWRPWITLEDLFDSKKYPHGQLYVIGGRPGDMAAISRGAAGQREYPVQLGFQHSIPDLDDTSAIDSLVGFIEELEETLRIEVVQAYPWIAFSRIEPMHDQNGIPLGFIQIRELNVFEAYFTAYYTQVLPHYNIATTTTT